MPEHKDLRTEIQAAVNKKGSWGEYHSSYLTFCGEELVHRVVNTYCYSDITYCPKPLSEVFIFFPTPNENQVAWADYIINRSIFAPAFLTTDVKDGFELGFEVNPLADYGLMKAGMIALRHPFEFEGWDFKSVVDMGFSETEAYALVSKYVDEGGELEQRCGNSNHMVFSYESPYGAYEGKFYQPEGTSIGEGNHTPFKRTFLQTFNDCGLLPRQDSGMWDKENLIEKLNLMKGV